jgi:SAM-dependent methyltransferase
MRMSASTDPLIFPYAANPHWLTPEVERVFRPEYRHILGGGFAMQTLLDHCPFETVLDVGCGSGAHAEVFARSGKHVTCIDYGRSKYFADNPDIAEVIIGDFNTYPFDRSFDCVWASHILEHQPNVNLFLRRLIEVARDGGWIAITVPPAKHQIVGGHLTLWNAGLLLYNLVVAGLDCRDAMICRYGYNISVIVPRRRIIPAPELVYDSGDVDRLAPFLPAGCGEGFHGDIWALNWPGVPDRRSL